MFVGINSSTDDLINSRAIIRLAIRLQGVRWTHSSHLAFNGIVTGCLASVHPVHRPKKTSPISVPCRKRSASKRRSCVWVARISIANRHLMSEHYFKTEKWLNYPPSFAMQISLPLAVGPAHSHAKRASMNCIIVSMLLISTIPNGSESELARQAEDRIREHC